MSEKYDPKLIDTSKVISIIEWKKKKINKPHNDDGPPRPPGIAMPMPKVA